jgi:hypothetical protein
LALELGQGEFLVFGFRTGGFDPFGDLGSGGLGMVHAGQVRHGLGALFAAADRHVGGFIGTQDGKGMFEGFELAAELIEFFE